MNTLATSRRHPEDTENSKARKALSDIFDESYLDQMQIRIGIALAAEEAKEESARRRINAPLTIEEKIFFLSHWACETPSK